MAKKDDKDKDQGTNRPSMAPAPPAAVDTAPPAAAEASPAPGPTEDQPPAAAAAAPPVPSTPPPDRLTAAELRELGAVESESESGDFVLIQTRGGVLLRFPGDEEKAGALDDDLLFGPEDAAAPAPSAGAEAPNRLTLEDLRRMGAILAESRDGASTDVVTRGGQKLRFPQDEERAAKMTHAQLTGEAPVFPSVESGTLQPRALRDLVEMDCILSSRTEGGKTYVVTKGGQKLVFPGDEIKAARLTDGQLTGVSSHPAPRVNEDTTLLGKPIR